MTEDDGDRLLRVTEDDGRLSLRCDRGARGPCWTVTGEDAGRTEPHGDPGHSRETPSSSLGWGCCAGASLSCGHSRAQAALCSGEPPCGLAFASAARVRACVCVSILPQLGGSRVVASLAMLLCSRRSSGVSLRAPPRPVLHISQAPSSPSSPRGPLHLPPPPALASPCTS